ncbi:NAD-dependent epimerase/dehydratase family protein [Modestobacter sp. VKM Ac-2979]|uniref:NAD-dependent epimerase/dehydratase family protein n=1 Tax=unclassified Modestobacter TaxID=2643866 RepID=UPI0022ABA99B|nr:MULTISPECIES: NAD-dependent epimerase/dehydratase family protein [unclassified Modestobacter]MCZ2811762.1 NAD-dependent epimerase/dehydratase family protein [Modestobacter sp. VKM Ac-2979]MCZ2843485.1 NAD-dependent epimerase/dehydratase family protein [Modestobacter sp. VKM Ac-2980]
MTDTDDRTTTGSPGSAGDGVGLTVAVTGPTGTFGAGLVPLLQSDPGVARIVGVARRPFDPADRGWTKMEYRRGDVRDASTLADAFAGADVVVHLAFHITGNARPEEIRAINVDGTRNAFRAASAAGARRFVHASSVAAYGFSRDNPVGMTEEWPVRTSSRLFYAREKAEVEELLVTEAVAAPDVALYLLRPPLVLGPHSLGAKDLLPGSLAPLARRFAGAAIRRLPVPVPVAVPAVPVQFVHEDDVGSALLLCVLGAGPPGAYNIAGDGVLTAADVARECGALPLPLPAGPAQLAARAVSRLPFLPPPAQWVEALSHPAIMDTTKARTQLGWRPRYTGLQALRDTVSR